jgi:hypothetical protein
VKPVGGTRLACLRLLRRNHALISPYLNRIFATMWRAGFELPEFNPVETPLPRLRGGC